MVTARRVSRVGARQGHSEEGVSAHDRRQGEVAILQDSSDGAELPEHRVFRCVGCKGAVPDTFLTFPCDPCADVPLSPLCM